MDSKLLSFLFLLLLNATGCDIVCTQTNFTLFFFIIPFDLVYQNDTEKKTEKKKKKLAKHMNFARLKSVKFQSPPERIYFSVCMFVMI